MALAAERNNCAENKRTPDEIVPMPRPDHKSGDEVHLTPRIGVPQHTERVTDLAKKTKDTVKRAYEQRKDETLRSYSRMVDRAQALGRRTQAGMRQARNEHPLQLLVVMACAAFVFGIGIRIWRSRTS
jgi:hypothetical protein